MPFPIRRLLAALLVVSTSALPLSGMAGAAMLPTAEAAIPEDTTAGAARVRLAAAIARPDLSAQLTALGLAPDEAARRVAALDDSTAIDAAANLDRVPAGAGVVGVAVFVFAVLVITDAIGLTRIFSFIRR
jgi:hypothetical protein